MPMNAYTGATGAGKTYQVMEHLIIKEIALGRSIVTNIEGIDVLGVYIYILCKARDVREKVTLPDGRIYERDKIVCLGSLRHITDDQIDGAGEKFFPYIKNEGGVKHYIDADSVVKSGEYVLLDEAANWWGNDCKIVRSHGQFFREHRHFTNEITGESCDIVFIVQDISYLHRSLRSKGGIRYTFWIEKMDMVGMVKRYKMLMYRGGSFTKNTKPERVEHGEYKEEVYLLYSSYAKGKGKEKIMDARQNVLNNPKKWKFIGGVVLIFLICAFFAARSLMGFFGQGKKSEDLAKKNDGPKTVAAAPSAAQSESNSEYRAVGWYQVGNNQFVLVRGENGLDRTLVNARGWYLDRLRYVGAVDGKQVANWTGKTGPENKVIK